MNLYEYLDDNKAYNTSTAIKGKDIAEALGISIRNVADQKYNYIDMDVVADKVYGYFIAKDIKDLEHYYNMINSTKNELEKLMYRINKRLNKRNNWQKKRRVVILILQGKHRRGILDNRCTTINVVCPRRQPPTFIVVCLLSFLFRIEV